MTDKTEAATNPFQIAELLGERGGLFKQGDRSFQVPLPCSGATGCDQCFRTKAWRNRTIER